jgi:GTP:adenosylcobinamide-phosphate guanylyltransferase
MPPDHPSLVFNRPRYRQPDPGWTAILLAGQRPGGDPLAAQFGVASKALIMVAGTSMLRRVADTLLDSPEVRRVIILAQDPEALLIGDAAPLRARPRVVLARSGPGIATSIAEVAGSVDAPWPVLVTTVDHVLLTPAMVAEFLSGTKGCDVAVGFGERRVLERSYPESRRTWLRFSDGQYSGANLFALRNAKVGAALALWAGIEQHRKKGWKLISRFGPGLLLRAVTRSISLEAGLGRAGQRLSIAARPVVLSAPEAAIDVDKPGDLALAEAILSGERVTDPGPFAPAAKLAS